MGARIAVLTSGSGTTVEAFIEQWAQKAIETEVGLVITNNKSARVIPRVRLLNKKYGLKIPVAVVNSQNYPDHLANLPGTQSINEQRAIIEAVKKHECQGIALMGYMKKIGAELIEEYGWQSSYSSPYQARMLNTHPGPLPQTKGLYGLGVQVYIIENNLEYAAQTLHLVAVNYDEGPTIIENRVDLVPGETAKELFERVKMVEKDHLPSDINRFMLEQTKFNQHLKGA